MNSDLIRFVDSISRDKNIDSESVYCDLEAAMVSAARKAYNDAEDVKVTIDRTSGSISAFVNGQAIDMKTLGRIAAQTAKQVMIQKIREDERGALFEEYSQKVGTVVTGSVTRSDGGAVTVNLGRGEGFLPRSEQIPGETYHPGERVRGMVLDVREEQSQVRIVLTQTHPEYIRKLFEMEVPEVGEKIIEIRALAREAGYRTKIAVSSIDIKVDPVGACVGVRGSRIRNIVDELGGEKIDIVRWNESSQVLITNSLKPAEVREVFLCFELGRATVIVEEAQLSLAIGKRGQNVRLAARLTEWDIDILTPEEYDKSIGAMEAALRDLDGVEDVLLDKLLAMGIISLADLAEVGAEPFIKELELDVELAEKIVSVAAEESQRLAEDAAKAKALAAAATAVPDPTDSTEPTNKDAPSSQDVGDDSSVASVGDQPVEANAEGGSKTSGEADEAQPVVGSSPETANDSSSSEDAQSEIGTDHEEPGESN